MDILRIVGWIFAIIFMLLPVAIFGGMLLTRDKTDAKKDKTSENNTEKHSFTKLNPKSKKQSLVVKQNANVKKEDVAAGVFGFGKSNDFALPEAGTKISSKVDPGINEEDLPPRFGKKPLLPPPAGLK